MQTITVKPERINLTTGQTVWFRNLNGEIRTAKVVCMADGGSSVFVGGNLYLPTRLYGESWGQGPAPEQATMKSFDGNQKRILRNLVRMPGYPIEISNDQVEPYCDLVRKLFSMIPEGQDKQDLLG